MSDQTTRVYTATSGEPGTAYSLAVPSLQPILDIFEEIKEIGEWVRTHRVGRAKLAGRRVVIYSRSPVR